MIIKNTPSEDEAPGGPGTKQRYTIQLNCQTIERPNLKGNMLALEQIGIYEEYEKVLYFMKISYSHALEHYKKEYSIDIEKLKYNYDMNRKEVDLKYIKPFEFADGLCKDIFEANRYNYLYTNRGKSSINILDYHNLSRYFADAITKEDNFKRKPAPEAILHLLKKHNIKRNETIMIGDRDIDILAGKNAGIKTCYFDYNGTDKVKVAEYKINSIKELYDIIGI